MGRTDTEYQMGNIVSRTESRSSTLTQTLPIAKIPELVPKKSDETRTIS